MASHSLLMKIGNMIKMLLFFFVKHALKRFESKVFLTRTNDNVLHISCILVAKLAYIALFYEFQSWFMTSRDTIQRKLLTSMERKPWSGLLTTTLKKLLRPAEIKTCSKFLSSLMLRNSPLSK